MKLTPSPNTIPHANGASAQYYNIKGIHANNNGTVSYTDSSGVPNVATVVGGTSPALIVGNVLISDCTTDLIILR